ncbi:MAG: VWA domain-containing protein [Myxococcota bacterium]|nr:VWA domain-containing protein [Myxococcota bacterium]
MALLALASCCFALYVHLRGPGSESQPHSAFILLRGHIDKHVRGVSRIYSRHLLFARLVLFICFTALIAGVHWRPDGGTILVVDGPISTPGEWDSPLTIVRAGYPPTEESNFESVRSVDAEPNWAAAVSFGRKLAPSAGTVQLLRQVRESKKQIRAGAALFGDAVVVSVVADADSPPRLTIGQTRYSLTQRSPDWFLRDRIESGVGLIEIEGRRPYPICIPDSDPLKVANTGWPDAVQALLKGLPHVQLVDPEDAEWRVGPALENGTHWAPFAANLTHFTFESKPEKLQPAILRFERDLPPPEVVLKHWSPLPNSSGPILLANHAPVVDMIRGPSGQTRRFGFSPDETDIPKTAAWPVLFFDALNHDRARRSRCLEISAGHATVLSSLNDVRLTYPDGRVKSLKTRDGLVVVPALDEQGVYTLESNGVVASLAVQQGQVKEGRVVQMPSESVAEVDRRAWQVLGILVALWIFLIPTGGRRRWLMLVIIILLGLSLVPELIGDREAPIVLAVDISQSMPKEETLAQVEAVTKTLSTRLTARVDGGDSVEQAVRANASLPEFRGGTKHAPILSTAAELAGSNGVIVLLSDGQASDGPIAVQNQVFTLAVNSSRPDARIRTANGIQVGGTQFIRVELMSDKTVAGRLKIGDEQIDVSLTAGDVQVIRTVSEPQDGSVVEVELFVDGDRLKANNRWLIHVRQPRSTKGVVVGSNADWLRRAGLNVTRVPPDELMERGAEISDARALAIIDVPAASIPATVQANIRRWVYSGGLLFLAGQSNAFGNGGWVGSELDAMSPLDSRPKRPNPQPVGVVFLIDRSGSQSEASGGPGLRAVADIASGLSSSLEKNDLVGLIGFSGDARVLTPLTPLEALNSSLPVPTLARGGTQLGPALTKAAELLARPGLMKKLVVLISDGHFADPGQLQPHVARLASEGVNFVGFAIGKRPDLSTMRRIAEQLDGTAVRASQPVHSLVLNRLSDVISESLVRPGGPVLADPSWSSRIGGNPPSIAGRIRTSLRPGARALATAGGEPILAEWQLGRGRVVSLATDRWTLSAEQWANLFGHALLPATGGPQFMKKNDRLWFKTAPNRPPAVGDVIFTDDTGRRLTRTWTPSGPGQSWTDIPKGRPGLLAVSTMTQSGAITDVISRAYPEELATTGVDKIALELQAAVTGGRRLGSPLEMKPVIEAAGRRPDPLYGIWAGLLCLLCGLVDCVIWTRRT